MERSGHIAAGACVTTGIDQSFGTPALVSAGSEFDTGLVKDLARRERGYNVTDAASGEVLSRHRTRAAAVDSWREAHSGMTVKIIRRDSNGEEILIVEGIWHEAHRW